MAHGLAQETDMFYLTAGGVPWHRLGVPLETAPETGGAAVRACGADWTAETRPLFHDVGGAMVRVPNHRVVTRSDSGAAIGVVGKGYTPLQNDVVASFFDSLVTDGHAAFETGGVLHGGSKVWFQVKFLEPWEVLPGDKVQPYCMLTNTHDGSQTANGTLTCIRAVCANTVGMAQREGKRMFAIRHTSTAEERLKAAAKVLEEARKSAEDTRLAFEVLAKARRDTAGIADYFKAVIPDGEHVIRTTRTENIRDQLMELHDKGRGTDLVPGIRGTLWGAYNAVTELVDHIRGTGDGDLDRAKIERRVESIWYGDGLRTKQRALGLALEMAGA